MVSNSLWPSIAHQATGMGCHFLLHGIFLTQASNQCLLNLLYWQEDYIPLCHLGSPAAAAKSLQSCPTLCYPIDGSPPGSPIPGILQVRILEWVAISFSNAWKWKLKVKSLSRVWLLATPWTAAHQASPSMGFSRQEYWSGVPLPSPWEALVSSKYNGGCALGNYQGGLGVRKAGRAMVSLQL